MADGNDDVEKAHVQVERTRVIVGGCLVGLSIVAVMATLFTVFPSNGTVTNATTSLVKQPSDLVAILGAVTTFLGTVIGVYFGVNVGQSGRAQGDAAVRRAADTAGKAVDAAGRATEAAAQITRSATTYTGQLASAHAEVMQALSDRK